MDILEHLALTVEGIVWSGMSTEKSGARNVHGVRRKTDTLKMMSFGVTRMREKLVELLREVQYQ